MTEKNMLPKRKNYAKIWTLVKKYWSKLKVLVLAENQHPVNFINKQFRIFLISTKKKYLQ